MGRSKTQVFGCLAERVEKKLKDWKGRTLSQAGKLTLLRSVIQTISTYLMSVFQIPAGIIDHIESAMCHFWWGHKHDERKGWRILQNPHSLLSRTLQDRYFRRRSFLTADMGFNPSYSWRSMLDGREVLKLGLGEPWVRTKPNPVLLPPFSQPAEEVFVSALFSQTTRYWDWDTLSALFSEEDSERIRAIPLRQMEEDNYLMWRWERNGIYSVRMGYAA
ncbi:hypothetical protein ACS0TY_030733 [Phlomoides rotata]